MLFPQRARPILLGHRGVREGVRENTLAAFVRAMEAGLDGVEFDVQRTRDGVLVVYHDFWIDLGLVHQLSYAELKAALPELATLEEVLDLFEGYPEAILNVELKSIPGFRDGRTEALAQVLSAWPGKDRVLVSSFDPVALYELERLAPDLPLGFLYHGFEAGEVARRLGFAAVHPRLELVSPERVAAWHRADLFVCTWPAATLSQAKAALAAGVDAVIGGWPRVLLEAKKDFRHVEVDDQPGDVGDGGDQWV